MYYYLSTPGLLRGLATLSLTGGWISMVLLFSQNVNYFSAYEFSNVWLACLVVYSAGTLFSIIIFILGSFAIFPYRIIMISTDVLWMCAFFILGSYAAKQENDLTNLNNITINGNTDTVYNYVNKGCFTATSGFGLLAGMVFVTDIIYFIFLNDECPYQA